MAFSGGFEALKIGEILRKRPHTGTRKAIPWSRGPGIPLIPGYPALSLVSKLLIDRREINTDVTRSQRDVVLP